MNILFDLDGTLTDPGAEGAIVSCIRYALERLGQPCRPSVVALIGPPLRESFGELLKSPTSARSTMSSMSTASVTQPLVCYENEVYPDPEALAKFSERGDTLFVATLEARDLRAAHFLEHFGLAGHFRKISGGCAPNWTALDRTRAN